MSDEVLKLQETLSPSARVIEMMGGPKDPVRAARLKAASAEAGTVGNRARAEAKIKRRRDKGHVIATDKQGVPTKFFRDRVFSL